MAAPLSTPESSDPRRPKPSTWDPLAPQPSLEEVSLQFFTEPEGDTDAEPTQPADAEAPEAPSPEDAASTGEESDPAQEAQPEGEAQGEDENISTVAQIAEALGVEQNDFLDTVTIQDSEGNPVPLTQVVDAWQATPDAVAAADERAQFEQQFAQRSADLQAEHDQHLTQAADMVRLLNDELMRMPSDQEIERMGVDNPDQAREMRLQAMERRQIIGDSLGKLEVEAGRRNEARQREHTAHMQREMKQVTRFWPELGNPTTRGEVDQKIRSYLGGIGFTGQQINDQLNSAPLFRVLKDALYGAEVRKASKGGINKLKDRGMAPPKPAPSARGEVPGEGEKSRQEASRRLETLRKTNSITDAASVFEGML